MSDNSIQIAGGYKDVFGGKHFVGNHLLASLENLRNECHRRAELSTDERTAFAESQQAKAYGNVLSQIKTKIVEAEKNS